VRRCTKSRRSPPGVCLGEILGEIERASHERVITGANRADGHRDGRVRFADARWANQQRAVMIANEARGGELHEACSRNLRIERPLKTGEVLDLHDAGLLQPPRDEAVGAPGELVLYEQIEKVQMRERRSGCLLEAEG